MKTFFSRFYMHFIEERKKNERIPVSYLFQMIKSLGILNEKQKAYGKRGETQAGQRGSRAAALFAENGLNERRSRAIYRILRWKDVCLFGASGAKRRMLRRGRSRGGAPKAAHLYNKQAHVLQPIAHFRVFFEG